MLSGAVICIVRCYCSSFMPSIISGGVQEPCKQSSGVGAWPDVRWWFYALQERLLGEDGNPRKTKDSEDPFRMGLVLEWVYGTIVSTAEKARDSAKKSLGETCSFD